MTTNFKTGVLLTLGLAASHAAFAQGTFFSDDFADGSTINNVSSPTADSTSYDFASSKTGVESISGSGLTFGLSSATTSGFVEAQALFTTTPLTLGTTGDYVDLTYTFTDTTGNLIAGGPNSAIFTGLYQSGGVAPYSISGGGSGHPVALSTTAGSSFATGGTALWQGYVGNILMSGTPSIYTRPQQTGGTTSANQDLIGNGFGGGTYVNNPGSTVGSATVLATSVALTAGDVYTVDYHLTLSSPGNITVSDDLFSGAGTGGTEIQSVTTTGTLTTSTFDGLAVGIRNSGTSLNPQMDINQITVTSDIQAVPEPGTFVLFGGGLSFLSLAWRRRQPRA